LGIQSAAGNEAEQAIQQKKHRNEQQPGHIMGARAFRATKFVALLIPSIAGLATPAFAAASEINTADTAWMIVATALVLMMTIPGLALFYSGMVRKKNVLATMAQSLAAVMIISILWVAFGYSLVFVGGGPWIGSLDRFFLSGMTMDSVNPAAKTIPEALFMLYQMTYGSENLSPFDLSLAVVGTGLLWVGWFGFNGGSALAANSRAVMAIVATHLAACSGALMWGAIEWSARRKPSVLGMISGAVAGLGTITPASGFVAPWEAVVIGLVAGSLCYWACTSLKIRFNYDDSLDVFGVHGVGGMTGTLLTGVFATAAIGGTSGLLENNPHQLLLQFYGVAVTLVWSGGVTWALLRLVGVFVPLRVSRQHEIEGLDITQHGEALQ
jgi:Amt family ammonium transporter